MNSFTKLAFSIKKKQSTNLLKALGLTGAAATGLGLGHVLHNSMLGTEALEQAAALNKARRQYSKLVEAVDQNIAEGKAMNNAMSQQEVLEGAAMNNAMSQQEVLEGTAMNNALPNEKVLTFGGKTVDPRLLNDNLSQREKIKLVQKIMNGK
jgi:hypothetical protein